MARINRIGVVVALSVALVATLAAAIVAVGPALRANAASGGPRRTETRAVAAFDRIKLDGAFSARIVAGAKTARVSVTAERDTLPRIVTAVERGTLVVSVRDGASHDDRASLEIDVPALRAFANAGVSSASISGVHGDTFAIENGGTGTIVATGRTTTETISNGGTGKIDATGLDARDVTVENDGIGAIRVRVTGTLTANVDGIGNIDYTGDPANVERNVNGLGRVRAI